MRAFASILAAEWKTRWRILAAALAMGLVPLIAGWARSADPNPMEVRDNMAAFLCFIFGVTVAVFTGATALASDLASGRTGFYLSRPISPGALFAGKMGGAWSLSWASAALVALPSILAPGGFRVLELPNPYFVLSPRLFHTQEEFLSPVVGIPLLLLILGLCALLAHAVSVAVRSRCAWLLLDLAGCAAAGTVIALWMRPIYRAFGGGGLVSHGVILFCLLGAALFAAALWQTLRCGMDVRRAHGLLSPVFWILVSAVVLPYWGFAQAAAHPPLSAMERLDGAWPLDGGRLLCIRGHVARRAWRFNPVYVADLDTGRAFLAGTDWWRNQPIGIGGGRVLLPGEEGDYPNSGWLRVGSFRNGKWDVEETAIPGNGSLLASFAPDRFGRMDDRRVTVYDSESLLPLWSIPLEKGYWRGAILADGSVRIWGNAEKNPGTADHENLLILASERDGGEPALLAKLPRAYLFALDPRTGAMVAGLAKQEDWSRRMQAVLIQGDPGGEPVDLLPGGRMHGARFLEDGIAVAARSGEASVLHLLAPDGASRGAMAFPSTQRLRIMGEPACGRLFVIAIAPSAEGESPYREDGELLLLDLERREVVRRWPGIRPLTPWFAHLSRQWEKPGGPWSTLFRRGEREIVRVDPETGEPTHLLP